MAHLRYPLAMQRLRTMLMMCLCLPVVTSLVSAASTAPPEPNLRKTPAAWVGFILMFLFFGIVIGISLMSSKRGHQD